jgi:NAD-dependent deacetylase
MDDIIQQIASLIIKTGKCAALTGAGISAESGIPTFRSKGGLWEKYDPAVYASIQVFRQDPSKYWSIRGDFIRNYDTYQPNPAHDALTQLEQMGFLSSIITQNIDGLHKKAGTKNVIEIHGSLRETTCLSCGKEFIAPHIPEGFPPYCPCGGVLKPNTVLFGENLPAEALMRAHEISMSCKLMLVIGTSAVVMPAAALPLMAQRSGGLVVEINLENAFSGADYFIQGKAGIVLPMLMNSVRRLIKISAKAND